MTCAQGLLRLLWGGPEVGVLRDWPRVDSKSYRPISFQCISYKILERLISGYVAHVEPIMDASKANGVLMWTVDRRPTQENRGSS